MFLSNPEYIRFHPAPPRIVFLLRSSLFACCYAPKKKIQKYLAGEREGFSLVELIIVIAIMAILIGVIALAVIPNIQRSRESKDLSTLDNILSSANIAIANNQISGDGSFIIGGTNSGTGADKVQAAVQQELGSDMTLTSSAANATGVTKQIKVSWTAASATAAATITVEWGNGSVPCEYTDASAGEPADTNGKRLFKVESKATTS